MPIIIDRDRDFRPAINDLKDEFSQIKMMLEGIREKLEQMGVEPENLLKPNELEAASEITGISFDAPDDVEMHTIDMSDYESNDYPVDDTGMHAIDIEDKPEKPKVEDKPKKFKKKPGRPKKEVK